MKKLLSTIGLTVWLAGLAFGQAQTNTDCYRDIAGNLHCSSTTTDPAAEAARNGANAAKAGAVIGNSIDNWSKKRALKAQNDLNFFKDRVVHASCYNQFTAKYPDWWTYA
jgi:hypothetical protein